MPVRCSNSDCGKELKEGDNFCDECGGKTETVAAPREEDVVIEKSPTDAIPILKDVPPDAGEGAAPPPSTTGGVVVEVDKSGRYRLEELNQLRFRISNMTDEEVRVTLRSEIARCRQEEEDRVRSRLLRPGDRQRIFAVAFEAVKPGMLPVRTFHLEVVPAGGPKTARAYTLSDDSLAVYVERPGAAGEKAGTVYNGPVIRLENIQEMYGNKFDLHMLKEMFQVAEGETKIDWEFVQLIDDPERTAAVRRGRERKRFRLVERVGRIPITAAKLTATVEGEPRRFFIFGRPELAIGRSAACQSGRNCPHPARNNDVILRGLPCDCGFTGRCRTCREVSLKLSGCHGTLRFREDAVWICDENSRFGTAVNGVKVPPGEQGARRLSDACRVSLGGGALNLDMRVYRSRDANPPIIEGPDPRAPLSGTGYWTVRTIGIDKKLGVDALQIRRFGNGERHEYLMLLRQAIIGSDNSAPIRVPIPGVSPFHALLMRYRGEFLIMDDAVDPADTFVGGRRLEEGECMPLIPGDEIKLGEVPIRFDLVNPEDFKSL